jgi:hypothetical protein
MSELKGRHFEGEIVLWAVRRYCRYSVSYRDLEQMMGERGVPAYIRSDNGPAFVAKAVQDWISAVGGTIGNSVYGLSD